MTFNIRKLSLSTCGVLRSPSSFFWGTEGSALFTDNYKNQAIVVILKEKQSKMLDFPLRISDLVERSPVCYTATSAVSLLLQVKQ